MKPLYINGFSAHHLYKDTN